MSIANASEPGAAVHCYREWLRRRLLDPLLKLLGDGLGPGPAARALAVGALVGVMPLPWGTSLLCLVVALPLRLNPLAVQAGNYAAWPLQLLLAWPYLRLGGAWFPAATPVAATDDLLHTLANAGGAALCAWALTAPLLLPLLYAVSLRLVVALGARA
ncbi:hypothetical protein JCM30471_21070 [Desulfuromonas carbonis]|uniref:DUF2062 domain-containing protein n=1 Tax=Desulfuromonas sp. DDH964 TaxID=1823759 RepID=UPI00078E91CC|nr:DUF2062 domain-containing protein [Desulfuromonas sp. DDH964]AMV73688.1 hypothetical protein DBW_3390 [Desulfuromonas sp. DDH964]